MPLTEEQKRTNQLDRTYNRYLTLTAGKCKNDALKEFQKLRRLECADIKGDVQCISCLKIVPWNKSDAGHFISRRHTAVAFSRDNVWPQCKNCNIYLSGNVAEYRKQLCRKIGPYEVELLEVWKDLQVDFDKWIYAQKRELYRLMQKPFLERLTN